MSKKTIDPKPAAKTPTAAPTLALPVDLVPQLRAAASIEDAVRILSPATTPKAKPTAVYTLSTDCREPLPKARGACAVVFATVARRDGTFTAADIAEALPAVKSAKFWTRKLAKTGHLSEVQQ